MNGISERNLIHFDFERRDHWRYFGTGKHFPIFKLDMYLMMRTLKFDLDMCFLYITWCRLLVPCLSHLTLYRDSVGPQACNFYPFFWFHAYRISGCIPMLFACDYFSLQTTHTTPLRRVPVTPARALPCYPPEKWHGTVLERGLSDPIRSYQ